MAKKKSKRLISTVANKKNNISTIPVKGGDGLPEYSRYITTEKYRFFFESPKDGDKLKHKTNLFASRRGFCIVEDGAELVGRDMAITFARMVTAFINRNPHKVVSGIPPQIHHFFSYLSQDESQPKSIFEITIQHCRSFLNSRTKEGAISAKVFFNQIMPMHPYTKTLKCETLYYNPQGNNTTPIEKENFDLLLGERDYSDRVVMQILASCFYELEVWRKRYELVTTITKEKLGSNYIYNTAKQHELIEQLLTSDKKGYELIFKNMMLEYQQERYGNTLPLHAQLHTKINTLTRRVARFTKAGGVALHKGLVDYLASKMWSVYRNGKSIEWRPYLYFKSDHLGAVLALYLMSTTGKNQETIVSIKRNYNGRSWFENFDINLGVTKDTANSQKEVRVVGTKAKGRHGIKSIPIRIPLSSPIYKYMKLYDDILNDPNREYFFRFGGKKNIQGTLHRLYLSFTESFNIVDDNDSPLKGFDTTRLRKTFAGHMLFDLIDDVSSPEELVTKLREALNHQSFDTTLFSYILKTGMGSDIINSAIVALTTNLIDKAMSFKGKVCEDEKRSETSKEVFLCDCTDDTKPTHGIPIADRCRKYDMCLGCERSEVYATHIKSICYRVMQYDQMAKINPLEFSALMEDRRQIAVDTIARFKSEHRNGEFVVESSYQEAVDAMKNGVQLLPPVVQLS